MFLIKKTLAILFMVLAFSCTCKKTVIEATNESDTVTEAKMLEAGFKKATVVASTLKGDCPYTLKVDGENNLFDPINLEETYKISGMQVWFTYHPLRMMNRCEKANPIEIVEMHKAN